MAGSYNPSRVIVGFRQHYDLNQLGSFRSAEEKARASLKGFTGYVDVLKKFKFLNAVLVRVEPTLLDIFSLDAGAHDDVEYCDLDYFLKKANYRKSICSDHVKGIASGDLVRDIYAGATSETLGSGTRIALIDTGISPHPYLPALSFGEGWQMRKLWRPVLQDKHFENYYFSVLREEASRASPYSDTLTSKGLTVFSETVFGTYVDDAWVGFDLEITKWLRAQRQKKLPDLPEVRGLYGLMRKVSPYSWNFVDDCPNILDQDGHGTAMAGFFSALPPVSAGVLSELRSIFNSHHTTPPTYLEDALLVQEHDVLGAVPYSELLVLKCLDGSRVMSSTLTTLLLALERCLEQTPDIVYVGLALDGVDPAMVVALGKSIKLVSDAGSIIVAPAGNDGAACLSLPAIYDEVQAIAAAHFDPQGGAVQKAAYSNQANATLGQEVAFCASGGSSDAGILSTSTDYGFEYTCGTSVAAAVVAARIALEASELYAKDIHAVYSQLAGPTGFVNVSDIRREVSDWQPSRPFAYRTLSRVRGKLRYHVPSPPDAGLGYGMIG